MPTRASRAWARARPSSGPGPLPWTGLAAALLEDVETPGLDTLEGFDFATRPAHGDAADARLRPQAEMQPFARLGDEGVAGVERLDEFPARAC